MSDNPTMTCSCGTPTHDEIFCDKCRADGYSDLTKWIAALQEVEETEARND